MTVQHKKYLSDILKAANLIDSFLQEISDFESYAADLKTQSAVERQLGIIGEAANSLSKHSDINLQNFHKIVGLRNRLIHAYDHIDDTIIWTIIKSYLPPLRKEVETLLNKQD